ncbi:DUF1850 domain-containing protein [Larsenimonas suaedae]|uniref:DUF1850 domain-containing protein n=1 Tax=Larsenimonas suaedae TaxID=1851019 RepID=A0ABU1GTY7_9GAMM|nr:DUF1850 domain-containing protein [Larsenimonas suaedae]MCM2972163.1 DUF1850 domain-containing protein [Larsenimonas suaedae]MDR5895041.1 DUF1850 domain-containing protein [Larsenimonas suaedae]
MPLLVVNHDNLPYYAFVMPEQTTFQMRWRHSVEKEVWYETYRREHAALMLDQTRFKTFGAGVPSQGGARTELVDGFVVMRGFSRRVDPLWIQVAPDETYALGWGGAWFPFYFPERASLVHITATRGTLIHFAPSLVRPWLLKINKALNVFS